MTVESTLERAQLEIAEGRTWRAKEILASSLMQYGYQQEICRAYANVLLKAGEDVQAGAYYLLSVDDPDEVQTRAMELFLARYHKSDWRQLLAQFPKSARRAKRDDYPKPLRDRLVCLQAPEMLSESLESPTQSSNLFARLWPLACGVVAVGILALSLIGLFTLVSWLM